MSIRKKKFNNIGKIVGTLGNDIILRSVAYKY